MVSINDCLGSYRLIAEIRRGGFGSVYTGKHTFFEDEPIVAIKLPNYLSEKEYNLFIQEAQLLKKLKHPHILSVIDANIHAGTTPYLIMEYATNGSLYDLIRHQPSKPLPVDEAITILSHIGEALQYAHTREKPVIHCDLKPENILFNAKREALLADFGIAVVLSSEKTREVGMRGTLHYMAPEQFDGKPILESDQYALGCIAYELFTGKRPFIVDTPTIEAMWYQHTRVPPTPLRQLNPDLPTYIEQAVLKAMAKEPASRFANVSAFIAALHKTKQMWLDEGFGHHDSGHYEEALVAFEQAIQLDPTFATAYNAKGKALVGLQRYKKALEAYRQAVRLDFHYANAHYNKGEVLRMMKRSEEALGAYEYAIRFRPKYADEAHQKRGDTLCDLKRYEEALAAYEQTIQLNPRNATAHVAKGDVLCKLDKHEEALAAYEQAIQLNPRNATAHVAKGDVLCKLDRHKAAVGAYERAIRLTPKDVSVYNAKGSALCKLEQYEKALEAYDKAIQLDPQNVRAYINKGIALRISKNYEQSLAAYEQAIQLDSNNASVYYNKGNVLLTLQRYEEALHAYDQAIRLNPKYAKAYYNKGYVLELLGKAKDAEQAYEKSKQLGDSE